MTLRAAVVAALVALGSADASAQTFERLGSFNNVRATATDHCYGHSLTLWSSNGRVMGLLDRHDSLCGDPACSVLRDVSFDRGTGRLTFSSEIGTRLDFTGTVRRDDVLGTLNGERIRLDRDRTESAGLDSDRSLGGWCQFWSSVTRCCGVKQFCAGAR